ncbi:MAG TPA: tetratricopeptide repeat protein [Nannocystaceae bacterium]|nr:tetratricopeptide repeat protein [Nannocystaceae bacterium]
MQPEAPKSGTVADTDELAPEVPFGDLGPGATVSRYVVIERIGMGGMGIVYAAYDPELDRKLAIKLLQVDDVADERASMGRARLLREAQALAKLTHPNVVAVHDVGTWEGRVFVAMEFVRGRTLSRWVSETSPSPREIVAMYVQAGHGLAAAHAQGLVHRDFKPDNVIVGDDGRPRVLDFGLARSVGAPPELAAAPIEQWARESSLRIDTKVTRTGTLAGTPAYMAAEQFQGLPGDARTDQFSFCVALWEGLFGARPFPGEDRFALGVNVMSGKRKPMPNEPRLPKAWRRALERGLSSAAADRFATMNDLLTQLGEPPSRIPWIAAIGVASIGVAALAFGRDEVRSPCADPEVHIVTTWAPARRAALEEAFVASGSSLGAETGARVGKALDEYAASWTAAWTEACVATHERHERSTELFDRAMGCLRHRRDALAATASQLTRADADEVMHAVDAIAALPPIDRCADHDALLAAVAPPEAATRDAVDRLRHEAADAEVLGRLGRFDEGLADALALRPRALALGYRPLVAEIDLLTGDLSRAAGRSEDARRRLVDAAIEALAIGHDTVLARASTRLASEVGIGQSRYEEGMLWGRQAAAAVQRLGTGGPEDAELAETMCELLADKGDAVLALAQCTRAVELAAALYGDDDLRNAGAWQALGIADFIAGRAAEAEQEFQRVRVAWVEHKGELHPDVLQVDNSLAATCHALRGPAACVDAVGAVVAAAERVYGPDHPDVAAYANNHAIVLHELGRDVEAEAEARRALAIRRKTFGEDHPGVGAALGVLGQIALARGDLPGARAALDDALANLRKTRGEKHPDLVPALQHAAEVRVAQGERAAAVELLQQALTLATELGRPQTELDQIRDALAQ